MVKPAALAKAEALVGHARYLGVQPKEFAVSVTLGEAYELLDYLAELHPQNAVLEGDIRAAKLEANPWRVFEHFQLAGLEIVRTQDLH